MTYHQVCNKSNMTDATSGAGYPTLPEHLSFVAIHLHLTTSWLELLILPEHPSFMAIHLHLTTSWLELLILPEHPSSVAIHLHLTTSWQEFLILPEYPSFVTIHLHLTSLRQGTSYPSGAPEFRSNPLSLLKLWDRIPLMARCTRYNIMLQGLSVTCVWSVVFSKYSGVLHQ